MALMEISVVPMGTGQVSVGDYVADVVRYLQEHNIPHRLTDMGTIVEGDAESLLAVARALHELPFRRQVQRVLTDIKIDDRRDKPVHLEDKVKGVSRRL